MRNRFGKVREALKGRNAALVKYAVALVPIIWIFRSVDFGKLASAFKTTAPWVIPFIVFLGIFLMLLQGVKWWILLRAFMPGLPLPEVLSCHFKGIYYSIFLPTSAAQDVVRSVLLSRNNDYGVTWGAAWLARITGLLAMLMLSLYGVLTIDSSAAPRGMLPVTAAAWGIILLLGFMSFSKRLTRVFNSALAGIAPPAFMTAVRHIRDGIYRYRAKLPCLLGVMLITLAIQALFVLNAVMMIRGITGKFFVAECFMYIPLIELICLSLPLTPNGIGIRDGLSALMFAQMGLPPEQLGTYVLLGFGTVAIKLVGAVPVIRDAVARRAPVKGT